MIKHQTISEAERRLRAIATLSVEEKHLLDYVQSTDDSERAEKVLIMRILGMTRRASEEWMDKHEETLLNEN